MHQEPVALVHHTKMMHRIHRIQGQLVALEQAIKADKSCDELIIQGRAIERAVASLITFMLCCQLKKHMDQSSDTAYIAAFYVGRLHIKPL